MHHSMAVADLGVRTSPDDVGEVLEVLEVAQESVPDTIGADDAPIANSSRGHKALRLVPQPLGFTLSQPGSCANPRRLRVA